MRKVWVFLCTRMDGEILMILDLHDIYRFVSIHYRQSFYYLTGFVNFLIIDVGICSSSQIYYVLYIKSIIMCFLYLWNRYTSLNKWFVHLYSLVFQVIVDTVIYKTTANMFWQFLWFLFWAIERLVRTNGWPQQKGLVQSWRWTNTLSGCLQRMFCHFLRWLSCLLFNVGNARNKSGHAMYCRFSADHVDEVNLTQI